jgi:hypothetical protein
MSNKLEPFKIAVGGTYKCFRHKVKRPRVVGFHIEGRYLMAELSCGHSVQYCRVPKWTSCYQCNTETIHFERPRDGYKEIPITNTIPQ